MPIPAIAGAFALAAEFAPSLIRLFAGEKAGEVAEKVAGVAKAVTGAEDIGQAAAVLRANPELALQFKMRAGELELEHEKLHQADRADARQMSIERARISVESAKADARRKNWMIVGNVVGLLACLAFLLLQPEAPESVRTLVGTIAAGFLLCLRDAHQFEFGSSRGSLEKTALLAEKR